MFTRTAPPSVKAVSGRVNQSTTVPPAVSVTWMGAVQPATVLVTVGGYARAPARPCLLSTDAVLTADVVSVGNTWLPVGPLTNVRFSVTCTQVSPFAPPVGPLMLAKNVKPEAIVVESSPKMRTLQPVATLAGHARGRRLAEVVDRGGGKRHLGRAGRLVDEGDHARRAIDLLDAPVDGDVGRGARLGRPDIPGDAARDGHVGVQWRRIPHERAGAGDDLKTGSRPRHGRDTGYRSSAQNLPSSPGERGSRQTRCHAGSHRCCPSNSRVRSRCPARTTL